jgi:hypothetical protein
MVLNSSAISQANLSQGKRVNALAVSLYLSHRSYNHPSKSLKDSSNLLAAQAKPAPDFKSMQAMCNVPSIQALHQQAAVT